MMNTTKTPIVNENKIQAAEISPRQKVMMLSGKYGLLAMAVLLFAVFGLIDGSFARPSNILDIFRTASIYGICALGLSLIMITGEIDFCCGMEMAAGGCAISLLLDSDTFNSYFLAVIAVLILCAALGAVNWILHCKVGIPAFIATMGSSLVVQGILVRLTSSARVFSTKWPENFKVLGTGRLFGVIPYPAICFAVLSILLLFFTEATNSGKKLYAVGSNPVACKYVGIDPSREKLKAFVIGSMCAAFAGIIHASTNGGAIYSMGDNALLNGLIILMLGATFWRIGVFNVPGTIVGAVIISALDNGLTIFGVGSFGKYLTKGMVLLLAVFIVTVIRRRTARGKS